MVSKTCIRRGSLIVVVSGLLALVASPVYADMGIPMIAWILPASWLLLIPVILVEAVVATRLLGKNYWEALKLSTAANAVSTIVGIPITWMLLLLAQIVLGGEQAHGLVTFVQRVYAVTLQSPWLIPYDSNELRWMFPAAGIFLCIPFFFASVFCEYLVVNKLNPGKAAVVKHWAWIANATSYGLIVALLIVLLVKALL